MPGGGLPPWLAMGEVSLVPPPFPNCATIDFAPYLDKKMMIQKSLNREEESRFKTSAGKKIRKRSI